MPRKRKPGRPTLLTLEVQRKVCEAFANGHTINNAARAAGVSPATLSRWVRMGRKTRAGKFRRLVEALDTARDSLCEVLDNTEIEVAMDKTAPGATRLAAVRQIRARVFGHAQDPARVDVYHHHRHEVSVEADQEEEPPRSLVSDDAITRGPEEELRALLSTLRAERRALPGPAPDVIDAETK